MSAVVEDVLQTRLDLVGLGEWTSGYGQAVAAVGLLDAKLSDLERRRLSFGVAGLAAATGIMVGVGRAALAAGDSQEILNRAVRNFKGSFPASELDDYASSISRLTGVDDEAIIDFLGLLGTFQVPKQDAMALAMPILNATEALRAQGATADQIATQVGKALQTGDPAALRRSGVILDQVAFKAADAASRAKMLTEALNAQGGANAAEEYRKSIQGSLQALNTELGNVQENFGGAGANPFTGIINGATSFLQLLNGMPEGVWETLTVGSVALAGSLAVTSVRAGIAVVNIGRLAKENIELTNNSLKARQAADGQASAEERGAAAMKGAAADATVLAAELNNVAAAHTRAGAAAQGSAGTVAKTAVEALTEGIGAVGGASGAVAGAASKTTNRQKRRKPVNVAAEIAAELAAEGSGTGDVDDAIAAIRSSKTTTRQVAKNAVAAEIAEDIAKEATATREALVEEAVAAVRVAPEPDVPLATRQMRLGPAATAPASTGFWGRFRRRPQSAAEIRWQLEAAEASGNPPALPERFSQKARSVMGNPVVQAASIIGGEMLLSQLPSEGAAGMWKGAGMGALAGFGLGQSFGPYGAAAGAALGGFLGFSQSQSAQRELADKKAMGGDPVVEELRRQRDLLQQQLDELRGLRTATAFSGKDVPGAQQRALASMGQLIA